MPSRKVTEPVQTGYDAVFDPDLDPKYKCPVCLAALRDPVQTKCGHRFCRACLKHSRGKALYGKCPVDKTWFDPARHVFEDNAVKREVLSLDIKCDNHIEGCEWKGELRNREGHLTDCLEVDTKCDNNCGHVCSRKLMLEHVEQCPRRIEPCQKCGLSLIATEIAKHQLLACEKFPVTCTVCGEPSILREDMTRHVDILHGDCPLVVVQCQFENIGCYFQDKRKNMNSHHQSASLHHLQLLTMKVQHQQDQIVSQQSTLTDLTDQCTQFQDQCAQLNTVTEQQQRMIQEQGSLIQLQAACILELESNHTNTGRLLWRLRLNDDPMTCVTSPTFFTHHHGYQVSLALEPSDSQLCSLYLRAPAQDADQLPDEPFEGTCHVTIFDQSQQRDTFRSSFPFSLSSMPATEPGTERTGLVGFMSAERLLSPVYTKDSSLLVLVEVRRNPQHV